MQRDDESLGDGCDATLIDASGPRWLRFLPHIAAVTTFVTACAIAPVAPALAAVLVALAIATLASARFPPLLLEWFAVRKVRLRFVPGAVEVGGAGLFRRTRLAARHAEGASTARTKDGYRITLRHAARPRPVALEVRTLDELQRVCRALGVGTRGYGSLAFPARPTAMNVVESGLRAITTACALAFVAAVVADDGDWAQIATLVGGIAALGAMVSALERLYSGAPTIRLDAQSIQLPATRAYPWIDYRAIESLVPGRRAFIARVKHAHGSYELVLDTYRVPLVPEGMSRLEGELFAETVLTAVARARGKGVPIETHEAATLHLERRADETPAEWLARLDALATGPQAAYRSATLRAEDLVRVLEDTDVSPQVRAAAARVLARRPGELRLRVEPVVAAEHDEAARVRIAAAADGRDDEFLRLVAEDEAAESPAARAKRVRH
jgi:hypothetical protein